MYNRSELFNNAIRGNVRKLLARVKFGDQEITEGFKSIKAVSRSCSSDCITIGGAVSSYVEIELWKPDFELEDKEIEVSIGVSLENGPQFVPLGLFTVQKPKDDDGVIKFTAYDRITSKMSGAYFSKLTYPADGKTVLQEISAFTGVPIDTSSLPDGIMVPRRAVITEKGVDSNGNAVTNTTYEEPFNGYSYREALGYVAMLYCTFATADRAGTIVFRWYSDAGYTVGPDRYYDDLVTGELVFGVQALSCKTPAETLTAGTGEKNIQLENPVMTKERLSLIHRQISSFEFLPASLSFYGDVCPEVGDIITVNDKYGNIIKLPVMSIIHEFDGGFLTRIQSFGGVKEENRAKGPTLQRLDRTYMELFLVKELIGSKASFDYVYSVDGEFKNLSADYGTYKGLVAGQFSATNGQITNLSGEYASFKEQTTQRLIATDAEITNLKTTTLALDNLIATKADITDLAATNARIDNINAGTVTTEYLKANYASIDLANVETASVGELLARTGVLTDMTVVNGYVTGQLNGVRINADVITAGTLSVDRLMVTGEDSIVYQINVASSGLSMEELADEKYQKYLNGTDIVAASITGDRIAGNTITGNHIIANSIHGDRILAGSITGDRITANAITSREINVTDLFAQDITATGTIRGVTLEGAKGMIGGWNIEKNCLYTDGSVALPNYSKTIVLQNPRKNLFANASISATGCAASLIKNSTVRITATQDGAGSVKIELPKIPPGEYVVEFLTNYGGNGLLSDRGELRIGWYIPNSGNLADETGWELLSEAGLAERNVRKFTIPDQNGRIQALRLTYIMSKMRSGEEYELTFQITVDDEELYGEASIVEDVPSNAVLCIRDTVNRKNSIPFYLDDDGNIYCGTMRSYSGNIGPFRYNGERIKSVFTLETLGTSGTAGKTTDYTIDINSHGFLNPSDKPINIYYTENARSKNDLFYVTAEGNVFAKNSLSTKKIYTGSIELSEPYPYIDFHFNNSTKDYTSRIWESSEEHLDVNGVSFYKGSAFANNWFRSIGNSGWYSQDYGGGWWMADSTWIRSYGDKSIYQNTGILRTDGTLQVGHNGTYFNANSAGASFGVNLTLGSHNLIFNNTYGIQSGGHWVIRQYTTSADNKTVCIGCGNASQPLRLFTTNSRVWLHNGNSYFAITSGSDRRLKKDFSEITEAYEKMYMDVDVSAFRYILDDDAIHYGFMAQDVEAALRKNNLPAESNLYGVCTAENNEAAVIHDTNVYHVNYLEWVPLNKHMITKTIRRLDMLEADTETKFNMLSSKTDSAEHRLAEITEELARMQAENQAIKTELEQLKQQRASVA